MQISNFEIFLGPFGYSFFIEEETAPPAAFYFGAVNGWTLQTFFDFEPTKPNPDVWQLPQSCQQDIKSCPNIWG